MHLRNYTFIKRICTHFPSTKSFNSSSNSYGKLFLVSGTISTCVALSFDPFYYMNNSPATCEHYASNDNEHDSEEVRSFDQSIGFYKTLLPELKEKWDWNNMNSRIPTVSWPNDIPSEEELSRLQIDLNYCKGSDSSDNYCNNLQFRIASFMLLQTHSPQYQTEGLEIMKNLAEDAKYPDAMCFYGMCLNDGRGNLESNPSYATSWFQLAADKYNHTQSMYELGVAFYTGEGVTEDEEMAVNYFRKAAENGHAGAAYMLGDCLLDGIGVKRDRAEALDWLVTSAELGHRGARSRVLAVLEKNEGENYGGFTDASRQTLLSDLVERKTIDEKQQNLMLRDRAEMRKYSTKPVNLERRYTIGGGARNPKVLARRMTIVQESRFEN